MYEKAYGSKYAETRDLDIAEIAKLVRKGIKSHQSDGLLPPKAKFAVRISRYSGGQAMDVTVSGMPDTWIYNEPGREPNYAENIPWHGGYTANAQDVLRTVEKIVFSYNYDGSDTQTDYFDVRFSSHVRIIDEREQRLVDDEKAKTRARQAARKR